MDSSSKLLKRYPYFSIEEDDGFYEVWDISKENQETLKKITRDAVIMHSRGLIGLGKTKEEALLDAVNRTEIRECIKL